MTGGQQGRGASQRWLNGAKIAKLRRQSGLTQTQFAELVEVSKQSMSDIERGRWGTSPARAKRIAEALGITVADISLDEDDADSRAA